MSRRSWIEPISVSDNVANVPASATQPVRPRGLAVVVRCHAHRAASNGSMPDHHVARLSSAPSWTESSHGLRFHFSSQAAITTTNRRLTSPTTVATRRVVALSDGACRPRMPTPGVSWFASWV